MVRNKKVLLHERKRHTAHHVLTTPSVVLTGYPPILTWLGGTLPGYLPPAGYPIPQQGTPTPWQGTPQQGTPPAGPGRVPPPGVCPMAFWEMLQSIMGTPLWTDRWMEGQTRVKTLPSRRTTYAGGNKMANGGAN